MTVGWDVGDSASHAVLAIVRLDNSLARAAGPLWLRASGRRLIFLAYKRGVRHHASHLTVAGRSPLLPLLLGLHGADSQVLSRGEGEEPDGRA